MGLEWSEKDMSNTDPNKPQDGTPTPHPQPDRPKITTKAHENESCDQER